MKPALNLPNTALAILFVLLLFAPMATQLLSLADGRSTDTGENRTLSSAPGLPDTLDGWIAYPATVERYYRDNFALRAPLLNTANILKLTLGIDLAPHYVAGKDDWVFFSNDATTEVLRGARPLEQNDLAAFRANMRRTQQQLGDIGILFLYFAVPEKQSIYPEYLPGRIEQVGPSHLDQVSTAEASSHYYVDVKSVLLAAKTGEAGKGRMLYHELDSHWTCWGAYLAYRAIVEQGLLSTDVSVPLVKEQEIAYRNLSSFNKTDYLSLDFWTTPVTSLSPRDTAYECLLEKDARVQMQVVKTGTVLPYINGEQYPPEASYPDTDVLFQNWHAVNRNPRVSLKALVVRDSFASRLTPYLNRTFSEVLYVHYLPIRRGTLRVAIEEFQPDVVIYEFAERQLNDRLHRVVDILERGLKE
tara:strand:- start:1301 stop:2548 length:1248 start_codon:yes stop_codon:yes gene_type:complete